MPSAIYCSQSRGTVAVVRKRRAKDGTENGKKRRAWATQKDFDGIGGIEMQGCCPQKLKADCLFGEF